METQHPEAMAQISRLEQKAPSKRPEDVPVIEKPNFGRSLRNQERLIEGQAVHMEATLTPVNDPTMKVEWFFNGQPIPSGKQCIHARQGKIKAKCVWKLIYIIAEQIVPFMSLITDLFSSKDVAGLRVMRLSDKKWNTLRIDLTVEMWTQTYC